MKKFIFASMVAIAMLVGIQPVFAEQFIAPEVSTSDSQCFVLDLPAGATAEAPECVAPWQVPEVAEVSAVTSSQSDTFLFTPFSKNFDLPNVYSVSVAITFSSFTGNLSYQILGIGPSDEQIYLGNGTITSSSGLSDTYDSSVRLKEVIVKITTLSSSYGGVSVSY